MSQNHDESTGQNAPDLPPVAPTPDSTAGDLGSSGSTQQGYPQQGYPQQGYGQPGGYDPNQPYGAAPYAGQGGYPQRPYAGQPPLSGQQPMSVSDERLWATLTHISIPFLGIIGPLVGYLVLRDRSAWLKESTTEALNFSILYTIAQIVSAMLVAVLIGFFLLFLVGVGGLILCILAAIASNEGKQYKYPLNWRLIK